LSFLRHIIKYVCPGYSPQRIELGLKLKEDAAKIGIEIDVAHPPDFNIFTNYVSSINHFGIQDPELDALVERLKGI